MGCLFFFLRPAANLVWSWQQRWGSATAHLPCVSHLLPLLPRCVGGGGDERLRRWSCAPVGEGRHRPLLTATVFAAGDVTGGRHRCHSQPRWMRAALRLPPLSSSSLSTAVTRHTHRRAASRPPSGCL
ncbi:hypothetical protein Tc00.1047053508033.20 [Trypanosoma cruzi]|uniref:Secreted protein n=1 Tax=Trypanosoma cruzi (strain CL Brener) TaxID=353153 RepID=Q4CXP2_TRYCC|nr:hypothetical protein Tc00.1047053508033.20 [Trypanosoma cruzi]EAN85043.1 hypothetical protein Tc00.1047053508033.20 [Trypanosoma cruzi]|eukprot:XP_806894.1 hypothetical protein [Trypanosoma cruzi strain CL Brener]